MINNLLHRVAAFSLKQRMAGVEQFMTKPFDAQERVFQFLLSKGRETSFGREHGLADVKNIEQFRNRVPVRVYEGFYPYIERALKGEANALWPGQTRWFAKSSGTTNDKSKFIPVPPDSLNLNHYKAGRDMLAMYLDGRPDSRVLAGRSLSMGGSHQISHFNDFARYGDISAVLIQNMPRFYEFRRAPSLSVALMGEWESKIEAIARETVKMDIRGMAGVPTWTVVLIHRLFQLTGKNDLSEIWPNLEVFFHGAVSFTPYRRQFAELIRSPRMAYRETYNASEGFFAVQNEANDYAMLLLLDHGIFYEFLPLEEVDKENPKTLLLSEIETDTQYALVISTCGGLWRYAIGDTVKFTSLKPYKLVISGRTKHFINAFGEEVVIENAEQAIERACAQTGAIVADYTACPVYFNGNEAGGHEWILEFARPPEDPKQFMTIVDETLKKINSDYEAKRHKDMALRFPVYHLAPTGTFYNWMKSRGKLGGQNKAPRLSNNRDYVESILAMIQN